ncbi:MAG: sigma-54-dependent transcriptional regulator [Coraliomargaritaceae bacterium]
MTAAKIKTVKKTPSILVIDDDNDLRYSLNRVFSSRGYHVIEAGSGEEGLEIAKESGAQVILLDNRMPGMTGIEVLQHMRGILPHAMIILMTAYGTTQTTIEAMKFGAYDYIMKPFDLKKILSLTESALAASQDLDKATDDSTAESSAKVSAEDIEGGIIGSSAPMQAVFKIIGQVAASDVTVMITGESGTGKELIARAIYSNSLRAGHPYIAVNCAAIPDNLIESELFGHEKGSFTGATSQRIGKFELCDGGTIFLDEIGDMALPTQTKILRALQEGEIQRVGSSETIRVNVRMLAATNKPLEEMVREKTFREDLYYRLNVVRVQLPALRERREDVPALVDFMLKQLSTKGQAQANSMAPDALSLLAAYDWPGNVRELENLVYRSAVMAQGETILIKDLPEELLQAVGYSKDASKDTAVEPKARDTEELGIPPLEPMDAAYASMRRDYSSNLLEQFERSIISRALKEFSGKQSEVVGLLGISRATLRKRMDQYGLDQSGS